MITSLHRPLNTSKILLITKQLDGRHIGGREQLSMLISRALHTLFRENFYKTELLEQTGSALAKAINAFRGRVDGLNDHAISQAAKLIHVNNISQVFIDGSNLGAAAKELKKLFPFVEFITFYHNVETRFFLGSLRRERSLKSLAVLIANFLAERHSTRYSDRIICLNVRDSNVLHQYFGRRATHISPIALDRPSGFFQTPTRQEINEEYALFVGGNFYANIDGIAWFRKYVSPRLDFLLYVVGRGLEQYRNRLDLPGKFKVIGAVDNLECWYVKSKFIIAPIFDGSGMKTKVAEALMYGKKIVGTPEAFVGYEAALPEAGWCCNTPDDFLKACEIASQDSSKSADDKLVAIFEREYSFDALIHRFRDILAVNNDS
jgi:glycosyltransferase involved in cell wall biosynthesis